MKSYIAANFSNKSSSTKAPVFHVDVHFQNHDFLLCNHFLIAKMQSEENSCRIIGHQQEKRKK